MIKTQDGKTPKTRVVEFDFSKRYSATEFETLYNDKLSDLDISMLINNVGVAA